MKKRLSLTLFMAIAAGISVAATAAAEDKPTANLSTGLYSKYVWRGFELSKDSIVIQPSATVAYKGFAANFWANMDTHIHDSFKVASEPDGEDFTWNETDLTLSYDWTMGPVTATTGYIYYALDGLPNTQEVFIGAGLDVLLKPKIKIYRDFDHLAGWYVTASVSHSFPIDKMSLDLTAQAGYLNADEASSYSEIDTGDAFRGFLDGNLTAALTIPVTERLTVTPSLSYSFPLTSDAGDLIESVSANRKDSSFLYGGVALSFSF